MASSVTLCSHLLGGWGRNPRLPQQHKPPYKPQVRSRPLRLFSFAFASSSYYPNSPSLHSLEVNSRGPRAKRRVLACSASLRTSLVLFLPFTALSGNICVYCPTVCHVPRRSSGGAYRSPRGGSARHKKTLDNLFPRCYNI